MKFSPPLDDVPRPRGAPRRWRAASGGPRSRNRSALSEIAGAPVSLKLECFQLTGSFKIRGAFFAMSRLSETERMQGVVTCSAGNHGKAVA